jgi:hypothetical protein
MFNLRSHSHLDEYLSIIPLKYSVSLSSMLSIDALRWGCRAQLLGTMKADRSSSDGRGVLRRRYGPPPSYPNLKIQGLNAPIPEGTRFGYEPGEWGKPPVDAYGRPIYGDVFGSSVKSTNQWEAAVDKSLRWGDLHLEVGEAGGEPNVRAPLRRCWARCLGVGGQRVQRCKSRES